MNGDYDIKLKHQAENRNLTEINLRIESRLKFNENNIFTQISK